MHEVKHRLEDLDKKFLTDKLFDFKNTLDGKLISKTRLGWAEYFANYFAACVLLPRRKLIKIYNEKYDCHIRKYHTCIRGRQVKYLKTIIKEISDETGASQSSIAIRLKETKIITQAQFKTLDYKFGKEAEMLFRYNHTKGDKDG